VESVEKGSAPGIRGRPVTLAGFAVTPEVPAVVVHIPHASIVVPDDVAADLVLTHEELEHQLLVMTDRYTDELFALPPTLATTVAFPVSRVVVDPERFTDDAHEPMAGKGMGVIYTKTASGQPLRRPPTADQRRHLLARFYEPHHAALTTAVETALAAHGNCLVLDGHSFPTRPQPYEDDQNPDRADICIGTDPGHTPDWLRDVAVRAFEALGWSVAVNRPFAGALVPMRFYRKDLRVRAIMVGEARIVHGRAVGCAPSAVRPGQGAHRGRVEKSGRRPRIVSG
jgi:N-formylglutamate deformylase